MTFRPHVSRSRLASAGAVAAAVALAATAVISSSTAGAAKPGAAPAVPAPPTSPTKADQIQNIDQVKTAIKGYYGDTVDPTTIDPVTMKADLHTFDLNGAYAKEVSKVAKNGQLYLGTQTAKPTGPKKPAVVFDVDDTTLNTYNYEIYSSFVYNPTSNAAFVNAGVFPAVPGMVSLEKYAEKVGYTVFFLTGRPSSQAAATVTNLTNVGYDITPANLYTKDLTNPIYASCAPSCTTIQYKSLTRAYIESKGYDLVANFGDQYSDLTGGYADKTYKVPNPMYYLP